MANGARWFVARFNLDDRRKDETHSAQRVGHEFVKDFLDDYSRVEEKSKVQSVESKRKLFWLMHKAALFKMEATVKRTTTDLDWPSVVSYFGMKTLEYLKEEGLHRERRIIH